MTQFLTLKKSNCKNCYKCIRHCPVKSIKFSANQAHIVEDECILCGQCFVVCPQNAKQIVNDTEKVKVLLGGEAPVIASVAPSFIANYNGTGILQLEAALKKLGFHSAEETAVGATLVKQEYDRLVNKNEKDIIISSCCNSVNLLIQKHYPNVLKYLADVVSPMQAHCLDIKKRYPDAKTVFIGPCLSKKEEAERYEGIVDCVLTFEELTQLFDEKNIKPEKGCDATDESRARFFPTTGGILKTMLCDNGDYTYMAIDGVENCINALKEIEKGNLSHCFIEMSACVGSCIGGPVMEKFHHSPLHDYREVANYAGKHDFNVEKLGNDKMKKQLDYIGTNKAMPSEKEIEEVLRKMGKNTPADELNCGSCGYNTCREKAAAVYQGKADLSMCLPFLKEKAESFSDNIINNTPNGILVLNEELEVQQINKAARKIMNIRNASDVLGEQVVRILDPKPFMDARDKGKNIHDRKTYYAEYDKYVEETILYDRNYRIIMCIMRDVSDEENERLKKESISRQTVAIADKVVDKQMRVVQEIASLLGETAAETKIALSKLKESITNE